MARRVLGSARAEEQRGFPPLSPSSNSGAAPVAAMKSEATTTREMIRGGLSRREHLRLEFSHDLLAASSPIRHPKSTKPDRKPAPKRVVNVPALKSNNSSDSKPGKPKKKRKRPGAASNQWTSVNTEHSRRTVVADASDEDEDDDADERQVNAGVYVLEALDSGHKFFGTTWDLRNAAVQSLRDLATPGAHPHEALAASYARDGGKSVRFRVLERVRVPFRTVKSPVRGVQAARSDQKQQEQLVFDAGDMENALRRRLVHHKRASERKAARILLQRALVEPILTRCWSRWALRRHQSDASDSDASLVGVQRWAERVAAAVEIQRVARGRSARRLVGELRRQRAVRRIERFVKAGALTLEVRRRVTTKERHKAAGRIQRAVRAWRVRLRTARALLAVRKWISARRLQSAYRGHRGRREAARRRQERRRKLAAIELERVARGFLARREAERRRRRRVESRAALVIQSRWRGVAARTSVRVLRERMEEKRRLEEATSLERATERIQRSVCRWWTDWRRRRDVYKAKRVATALRIQLFAARQWRRRRQLRQQRAKPLAVVARVVLLSVNGTRRQRQIQLQREQEKATNAAAARIQAAWRSHRLLLAVRTHVRAVHAQQRRQHAAQRIQSWVRARNRRHQQQVVAAKDAEEQPLADTRITNDVNDDSEKQQQQQQTRAATALQCLFRRRRARREVARRKQLLRLLSRSSTCSHSVCEDCRAACTASVLSSPPLLLRLCASCVSHRLAPTLSTESSTLLWDAEVFDKRLRPSVSMLQRRYRALQSKRSRSFGLCAICGIRAARRVCCSCRRPSAYDSVNLPCCLSCDAVVHSARNQRLAGHTRVAVERFRQKQNEAARRIQRRVRKWIRQRRARAVLDAMHKRATRALSRVVDRKRRQRQQREEEEARRRRTREKMARMLLVTVRTTQLAAQARRRVRLREEERSQAAATRIQSAFRRRRSVQRWRSTVVQLSKVATRAVTVLQRSARGFLDRRRVEMLRVVQARQRQEAQERRERACVVLQRHARGFLARRQVRKLRDRRHFTLTLAAKKIQRQWQCHKRYELLKTTAAVKIQSCTRRWLAQRLAGRVRRSNRLERARNARKTLRARCLAIEHASAARIERAVRRKLTQPASRARVRVQKLARRFLMRRAMRQTCVEVRAARRLQRAFRLSRATRRLSQQLEEGGGEQDDEDRKVAKAWVELLDEASGYVYYYNILTKASAWERPPEMDAGGPEVDAFTSSTSTSEWVEYWDENVGAAYYYNVKTGEATWAPPPELADRPTTTEFNDKQVELAADGSDYHDYYAYYGYGGVPAPSKLAWDHPQASINAAGNGGDYYDYCPADGDQQQQQQQGEDQTYYYDEDKEGCEEAPDSTYDTNYRIYVTQLDQQQQQEGEDQGGDRGTDGEDGEDGNEQQQDDGDGRGP